MKGILFISLLFAGTGGFAQESFDPKLVARGSELFATHCSTCHGNRMSKPEWAPVDLRKFPKGDHNRFVDTVTFGIRNMPPWEDVLKPNDIEALWAYVIAGEGKK
jgi:mono/diheme cytochrome c family protein